MATDATSPRDLRAWLATPMDGAAVAAFRVLFGALMLAAALRLELLGWVESQYVEPSFHFAWPGFGWLSPWPAWGMHLHVAVLALSACGVMLGLFYRASALVLALAFTSLELFDQTYYLNHYYLISLLSLLCVAMPLHRVGSLDALRHRRAGRRVAPTVPRWVPFTLRSQLAITYFFAGVAKLDGDWLLRAEPLGTWLQLHAGTPFIGPLLALPATAFAMAWAGALFDLSIGALLWWPRTRVAAYAALVVFHIATALLFPIGIFPLLMIAATSVFFAPDWPRHLVARLGMGRDTALAAGALKPLGLRATMPEPVHWLGCTALGLYLAVQLVLPMRHLAYPGDVNWTEEGFRFAWRVMLIDKTGHVELRVHDPQRNRTWLVTPSELTPLQRHMMATQPDMIVQYARHVAQQRGSRSPDGGGRLEVYADAWVSLNGRPAQRLLDPTVNLAAELPAHGAFAHRDYVLPLD